MIDSTAGRPQARTARRRITTGPAAKETTLRQPARPRPASTLHAPETTVFAESTI